MDHKRLTPELLSEYSVAALKNAAELLMEALLLYQNKHLARAYFLAVASIEEGGKAYLAFDCQGRNLKDSAVVSKVLRSMEDHQTKITNAFAAWLIASPNKRDSFTPAIDLMIHLRRGREPSMYTDLILQTGAVQVPARAVRERAALDCIRLAANCLIHTQKHLAEKKPEARSVAEDKLFAMKKGRFQKIGNTEDFWWYYLEQMKGGNADLALAVVTYHESYMQKGLQYGKRPDGLGGDP